MDSCRVAVEGRLWGPALLLARHCGDKAFIETAGAMAQASTTTGSPLHTLTLLLSGKADAVQASHAEQETHRNAAAAAQPSSPFGLGMPSASHDVLNQWRGHLAILASNRMAGSEVAMVQLGERLWHERSQVTSLWAGRFVHVGQSQSWSKLVQKALAHLLN